MVILVIFLIEALCDYVSRRDPSRAIKQLGVIAATCVGVGLLCLFYFYTFGDPLAPLHIEAALWDNTVTLSNLFDNVRIYGFEGLSEIVLNYSAMPILLVETLLVVAAALFLLKRSPALSVYSLGLLVIFLSLSTPMSFMRYVAAIFPLYLFFGFMLSEDWTKTATISVIAVVVAIQNMFLWISGAWIF